MKYSNYHGYSSESNTYKNSTKWRKDENHKRISRKDKPHYTFRHAFSHCLKVNNKKKKREKKLYNKSQNPWNKCENGIGTNINICTWLWISLLIGKPCTVAVLRPPISLCTVAILRPPISSYFTVAPPLSPKTSYHDTVPGICGEPFALSVQISLLFSFAFMGILKLVKDIIIRLL